MSPRTWLVRAAVAAARHRRLAAGRADAGAGARHRPGLHPAGARWPCTWRAAALAVAASFVVSVVVVRPARSTPRYPTWPFRAGLAARRLRRPAGAGRGVVAGHDRCSGYLVDSTSPLPAVLFWIGIWTGLPIAAVVLGNPWPSLSPFRTIFGALERVARLDRPRTGWTPALPIRARLGRWPAAAPPVRRPVGGAGPAGERDADHRRQPACSATRS